MRRATSTPDFIASAPSGERQQNGKKSVSPTVLIVDDSSFNLKVVSRVVSQLFTSARVATASDGREGVRMYKELRAQEPDVKLAMVVMDFNMPGVDGVTAARYIRALEAMDMGEEFKRASAGDGSNASSQSGELYNSGEKREAKPKPRRVPIVMYTTELQVVLPALIEGIIDDRIPKICSKELFQSTLARHLQDEFSQFLQPSLGYDKNRAHSENDMADIMLETDTWNLEQLYESLDEPSAAANEKDGRKRARAGTGEKSKFRRGGEDSEMIDLSTKPHGRTGFFARFPKTLRKFFGLQPSKTPRNKMIERQRKGAVMSEKSAMFARIQSEDNLRYVSHDRKSTM